MKITKGTKSIGFSGKNRLVAIGKVFEDGWGIVVWFTDWRLPKIWKIKTRRTSR